VGRTSIDAALGVLDCPNSPVNDTRGKT